MIFRISFSAAVCLSIALAVSVVSFGQGYQDCSADTVFGHVARGDSFKVSIGAGLQFQLTPSAAPNPEGWTMRVIGVDPARDYLMVATPPYRFGNPRYLDTSYGTPAEEALAWSPRSFQFVLNDADFDSMYAAIGTLLWPADHDALEIEHAGRVIESARKGTGKLVIIEGTASPADEEHPLGRIERVSFSVEYCL